MICERCYAEIRFDPLPAELDELLPPRCWVGRRIVDCLWRHRGQWVPSERLIAFVYQGGVAPRSADNSVAVTVSRRIRPRLPVGYVIQSERGSGPCRRRLLVRKAS